MQKSKKLEAFKNHADMIEIFVEIENLEKEFEEISKKMCDKFEKIALKINDKNISLKNCMYPKKLLSILERRFFDYCASVYNIKNKISEDKNGILTQTIEIFRKRFFDDFFDSTHRKKQKFQKQNFKLINLKKTGASKN